MPEQATFYPILAEIVDLYNQGGLMMFPLGLCSLVLMIVITDRVIVLRKGKLFPGGELERLRTSARLQPGSAEQLTPKGGHPVGRILEHGLSVYPCSAEQFKEALHDQARREMHYLRRGLVLLEIVVGIAPLFGLLGTALGMIDVFNHISLEGPGRTEALSRGIAEALLTTVAGLMIGIPALIAFNLFTRKVESIALMIEEEILYLYHQLFPNQ